MFDMHLPPGPLADARFRRMVDILPDAVFITQGDTIALVNPVGLGFLGAVTPDQVLGKSSLNFIHPDDHALVRERMHQALETNDVQPFMNVHIPDQSDRGFRRKVTADSD